jgi:hypothetical protein
MFVARCLELGLSNDIGAASFYELVRVARTDTDV